MFKGDPRKMTSDDAERPPFIGRIFKSRWFIAIVAAFVLAGIAAFIALPRVIKHVLKRELTAMGGEAVTVGGVGFNPFTLRLSLENLLVRRSGADELKVPQLEARLYWRGLWKKRLEIETVSIDGASVIVERLPDGSLRAGGLTGLAREKREKKKSKDDGKKWGLGLKSLLVTNSGVEFRSGGFMSTLVVERLLVKAFSSWEPEKKAEVELTGKINGGELDVKADAAPFSGRPLFSGKVRLSGMPLKPFEPLAAPALSNLEGTLHVDSLFEAVRTGGGVSLSQDGEISVRGARLSTGRMDFSGDAVAWRGTAGYARAGEKAGTVELSGAIESASFKAGPPRGGLALLGFKSLKAVNIKGEAWENLTVENISAKDFYLGVTPGGGKTHGGYGEAPVLSSSGLSLAGVGIDGLREFSVESAKLTDAAIFVFRDSKQRFVRIDTVLSALHELGPGGEAGEERPGKTFRIKKAALSKGSVIRFVDMSVKPPFSGDFTVESAVMEGIDTARAGLKSGFLIRGMYGKYTTVSIDGEAGLAAKGLTLGLKADIKSLDLPPLGDYTVRNLGYDITSGHMDADVTLGIDSGKMDGQNRLVLKNLDVEPRDKKKLDKLTRQLSMPLDTAISLLKDGSNNIRIDIPLSGDVSNPRFNFADAINQATGSALKGAAIAYLKYYFQPYGSLITLWSIAGELMRLRLDPVYFDPGTTEINDEARAYLDKAAGLLKDRPEVRLMLCGYGAPADLAPDGDGARAADKEGAGTAEKTLLDDLANRRSFAIKDYLVGNHGISPDRLFVCKPAVDDSRGAKPRVELLI